MTIQESCDDYASLTFGHPLQAAIERPRDGFSVDALRCGWLADRVEGHEVGAARPPRLVSDAPLRDRVEPAQGWKLAPLLTKLRGEAREHLLGQILSFLGRPHASPNEPENAPVVVR